MRTPVHFLAATLARLLMGLLCIGGMRVADAGTAYGVIGISATVVLKCAISTTAVGFGVYDPVVDNSNTGSDKVGTGSIVVLCIRNASGVTIGLGLGSHPSGSSRRLQGSTSGTFLDYELYQPTATTPAAACTGSKVWGTSGPNLLAPTGVDNWGSRSAKTFNICGVLRKGQLASTMIASEAYTDAVVATVNF